MGSSDHAVSEESRCQRECGTGHNPSRSPSIVSWLRAIRDASISIDLRVHAGMSGLHDGLYIADQAVWSGLGRAEETEVIDAVEGEESGEGGLVNLGPDRGEERLIGVGRAVGQRGRDLGVDSGRSGGEEEGDEAEHAE